MKNQLLTLALIFNTILLFSQECDITMDSGYPSITHPRCSESNGVIEINVSGSGNIKYQLNGGDEQESGLFENLSPGDYVVLATDETDCTFRFTTRLEGESGVEINSITVTDSSCNTDNGKLTINASGDELKYSINGGEFQTSNVFSNLGGGTYEIIVKDKKNCEDRRTQSIKKGTLTIENIEKNKVYCGNRNGKITVTATGSGTIQYKLEGVRNWQSSPVFNGLSAGAYQLSIKDNTCTITKPVTISSLLDFNTTITKPGCGENNGSIEVNVTTPGQYKYSIDRGATFNTTGKFENLSAGVYYVLMRTTDDSCGFGRSIKIEENNNITRLGSSSIGADCGESNGSIRAVATSNESITYKLYNEAEELITSNTTGEFTNLLPQRYKVKAISESCERERIVTVNENNDIQLNSIDKTRSLCATGTGSATINAVSIGANTLSYSMDNGSFQASNSFTDLAAGRHTIKIKSSTGCEVEQEFFVLEQNDISITGVNVDHTSTACLDDGIIRVTATGTDIEYSIDGTNYQPTGIFTGLAAGTYKVYLKNSLGCTKESGETEIFKKEFILNEVNLTNETCNNENGTIEIIAVGSELTYSINGTDYQSDNTFNNINDGEYTVYIKDEDGCILNRAITIENIGNVKMLEPTITPTKCGENNGQITANFVDNGENYTFSLTEDSGYQESPIFENISAGEYTIYVKNETNCLDSITAIVNESTPISITTDVKNLVCAGGIRDVKPGLIKINATGGVGELEYSFDGGVTFSSGNSYSVFDANTYSVIIRDEVGCEYIEEIQVSFDCEPLFPEAFSPNMNLQNDTFRIIYYLPIEILEFTVHNRFGNEVYSNQNFMSTDRSAWWTPSLAAPEGLYIIRCVYKLPMGNSTPLETKEYNGTVQLIR